METKRSRLWQWARVFILLFPDFLWFSFFLSLCLSVCLSFLQVLPFLLLESDLMFVFSLTVKSQREQVHLCSLRGGSPPFIYFPTRPSWTLTMCVCVCCVFFLNSCCRLHIIGYCFSSSKDMPKTQTTGFHFPVEGIYLGTGVIKTLGLVSTHGSTYTFSLTQTIQEK